MDVFNETTPPDLLADLVLERLSGRERQVFALIGLGVSPSTQAEKLGLSVKTVSTYRARIFEKLKICSNAEAAVLAWRIRKAA